METPFGNFIILHLWKENEDENVMEWVVSELTRDGQMVICRFIPSNETQQLKNPMYLSLGSDDRVFVTDYTSGRVILLDSDLKWNRILCPSKEKYTNTQQPLRLFYDEEEKQLIVGGYYGVTVFTLGTLLVENMGYHTLE